MQLNNSKDMQICRQYFGKLVELDLVLLKTFLVDVRILLFIFSCYYLFVYNFFITVFFVCSSKVSIPYDRAAF